MICHRGSACASQRLRQGSFQQPKVSPPPAKHTHFIQPSTPKSPAGPRRIPHRRVRVSSAGAGSPPGGHCCSLAFAASCGLITQAWDIRETPSIPPSPPPPSHQLWPLLRVSEGARGLARCKRARTSQGCPRSPSICRRSTRLLPCLQSDFVAERPRRVEMPPGLSAATAKPIRAGIFRRVFQTST